MKKLIFILLQCSWGILQNIAGCVLFLLLSGRPHSVYKYAIVTRWKKREGMSLGAFIFIPERCDRNLLYHEYGHCIQSMILGPFYLPVIALPSVLWCNFRPFKRKWISGQCSYYDFYPERWADSLNKVKRKEI